MMDDTALQEESLDSPANTTKPSGETVSHVWEALPLGLHCTTYATQTVVEDIVAESGAVGAPIKGLAMMKINGEDVSHMNWDQTYAKIQEADMPLTIVFAEPESKFIEGYAASLNPVAVKEAKEIVKASVNEGADNVRGIYLLKSFNHYSMEQERIVAVTNKAIYRIKYDFLSGKLEKSVRTDFKVMTRIQHGPLMWGDKVAMMMNSGETSNRQALPGVRIVEGTGEVGWMQRWNPMAAQPIQIFASHIRSKADLAAKDRNIDEFHGCFLKAFTEYYAEQGKDPRESGVEIIESTIRMEGSVAGKLYNDSSLGIALHKPSPEKAEHVPPLERK